MLKSTRVFSSGWHWLAAALIGLPLLIVLLVFLVLLWAETPTGSRQLLKIVQAQMELRAQTQMRYQEGRLKPLSGLYFRDLHVTRAAPDGRIDIEIPELSLKYAIHFLARRLEIDEFLLRGARIRMNLRPMLEKPSEEEKPAAPPDLEKLFKAPPLTLEARHIEVSDLAVDLTSETAQTKQVFKLNKLTLNLAFELIKEKFSSQGSIAKGASFALQANQKTPEGAVSDLGLSGGFSGDWRLALSREGAEWVYELSPSRFAFNVNDVKWLSRAGPAASTVARLKSLSGLGQLELLARTRELLKGTRDAVKTDKIHVEVDLGRAELAKTAEKTEPLGLAVEGQRLRLDSSLKDDVGVEAVYEMRGLNIPQKLAKSVNAKAEAQASVARDLESARFDSNLSVEGEKLLKLKGEAALSPEGRKSLKGQAAIAVAGQKILALLKPAQAAPLKKFLPLVAQADFDVSARKDGRMAGDIKFKVPKIILPAAPGPWSAELALKGERAEGSEAPIRITADLDADNAAFGRWSIQAREKITVTEERKALDGEIAVVQKRPGDSARMPLILEKPLNLEHQVDMRGQRADLELKLAAAELAVADKARLKDVKFACKVGSPDIQKHASIDVTMNASGGPIELDPRLGKTPLPLKGFEFAMNATLREATRLALQNLRFALNGRQIEVTADGSADSKNQDAQFKALAAVKFPDGGFELAGQTVRGRITLPIHLTIYRGREVSLSGEASLGDFAWSKDKMSASGINGRVPFSEKLDWDGKNIHFSRLMNQNPFERVAFERIRPLLSGAEQLRVDKITWEDRVYGPFIGYFSVEQNMLSIHQFDFDMGPGRIHGEMFFDAYPANLRLGVLARLTGLDMNEILPERFLKRLKPGEKVINGRSGFVLNINRGVLDGRIDVTDMGPDQLAALINVLDPSYEDSKMNKVRGLLRVGYPTSVSLVFRDGFMDMDIDLMILRVGQRESLREIPLSSILSGPTSEIVKTTEKGPLKQ